MKNHDEKGFFILVTAFCVFLLALLSLTPFMVIKPRFSAVKKFEEDINLIKRARDKCLKGEGTEEVAGRKILVERMKESDVGRKILFDANCNPIFIIY